MRSRPLFRVLMKVSDVRLQAFDKDMEAKLLTSALTRLDELPLRLVEIQSHGSPWHELASSDVVKKAMRDVPGFSSEIVSLARNKLRTIMPSKE